MTIVLGKLHHGDGSYDLAIADNAQDGENQAPGNFKTVVSFPESSGEKEVQHNVPPGTGDGEFSS
jgi:hypothetical protein